MESRLNIFSLAVKNLKRKPVRTALLVIAVTVVTGTLFSATLFISSMQNALKIGTYRLGADVLVVPEKYVAEARSALLAGEPTSFYMGRDVLEKVKKVEAVKDASPQLFIKPASFSCCFNVDVFLVAFDPKTDFSVTPWLEKKLKEPIEGNKIITGRNIPVVTEDTIPFFGTMFKVVGTTEPTGMKFFDQSVFMTIDAAYQMAEDSKKKSKQPLDIGKDKISAVLVRVKDGYTPERAAIRIEYDVPGVKAIASDEVISAVRRQLGGLLKGILGISIVLWIMALLMIGFSFYMIVNERQREFGLLRAMGAKKRMVSGLIIIEAVIISTGGGLTGILTGSALLYSFRDLMVKGLKLPYLLPNASVLSGLVAGAIIFSVLTGLIASLIPAAIAGRMDPYNAIRTGE